MPHDRGISSSPDCAALTRKPSCKKIGKKKISANKQAAKMNVESNGICISRRANKRSGKKEAVTRFCWAINSKLVKTNALTRLMLVTENHGK
ncbi:Uncharacterised protein [Vibrio cholerae]|nr:Uncharacterised protein [Vibrio cholerae]CSA52830.1 Uncharacterised protein [Vibrio cholerae]CSB24686.1 Uncharacterised protein [Vibrio cholerae]CSB35641.1 Uncharacterised protein [Vibrio cholerae]